VNAIIFQVLVGVAFVVLVRLDHGVFALHGSPQYFPLFAWMAGLGGLGLVVVYATIALGAVPGLWNYARRTSLVLAVAVGFVVSAGGIFGSIYKVSSPDNQWIWYLIGWVAVGSALTIWNLAHENHSLMARSESSAELVAPEMIDQLSEGDIA